MDPQLKVMLRNKFIAMMKEKAYSRGAEGFLPPSWLQQHLRSRYEADHPEYTRLKGEDKPQLPSNAEDDLLGGYTVGEMVYHIGASEAFLNGDRLVHGEQGEVIGPSPPGEFEGRLQIKFPNNKGIVHCRPADDLSRSPLPPLPGGYTLGEKLTSSGQARR